MSATEQVLRSNGNYVKEFKLGHLTMPPGRKLAIVACRDARLTVEQVLGLKTGRLNEVFQEAEELAGARR
ncbi:MAG: hypothetical protein WC450_12945 [Candidatus Omnitrophota bacterium]|jgi:carbonic anhydrase